MTTPSKVYKDWRGIPINPGDTVIYHGPTSGNLVGIVEDFTKAGSVRFNVIFGSSDMAKRSVPADRCTVILALPPSEVETVPEKIARRKAAYQLAEDNYASHNYHKQPVRPSFGDFRLLPGVKGALISKGAAWNGFKDTYETFDRSAYDKAMSTFQVEDMRWRQGSCTVCDTLRVSMSTVSCQDALDTRRV